MQAARVGPAGLEGDAHRDTAHHGGPERAVCVYPVEAIRALQAEGHPVAPGALGENVTLEGVDWGSAVPGAHLLLGQTVLLQVTRFTSPCANITGFFADGDYSRVAEKRHPGWSRVYTRVLVPGTIRQGDPARVLSDAEASARATAGGR